MKCSRERPDSPRDARSWAPGPRYPSCISRPGAAGVGRPALRAVRLSAQPAAWVEPGASAGTVKMLIHRRLVSYDRKGNLRGELAKSWSLDARRLGVPAARGLRIPQRRQGHGRRRQVDDRADRRRAFHRLMRAQFQQVARIEVRTRTIRLVTKERWRPAGWFAQLRHGASCWRKRTPPNEPSAPDPTVLVGAGTRHRSNSPPFDKLLQAGPAEAQNDQAHRLRRREPRASRAASRRRRHDRIRAVAVDGGGGSRPAAQARQQNTGRSWTSCSTARTARSPTRACVRPSRMRFSARTSSRRRSSAAANRSRACRSPEGTPLGTTRSSRMAGTTIRRGQGAACRGRLRERLPDHAAGHGAVRDAQGHRRNRPAVPRGHRYPVRAETAGLVDAREHGHPRTVRDRDPWRHRRQQRSRRTLRRDGHLALARAGRSFGRAARRHGRAVRARTSRVRPGQARRDLREMQRAALEEVPLVGLAWRRRVTAWTRRRRGFKNLPGALTTVSGACWKRRISADDVRPVDASRSRSCWSGWSPASCSWRSTWCPAIRRSCCCRRAAWRRIPAAVAELRAQLGLDRPLLVQYAEQLRGLLARRSRAARS